MHNVMTLAERERLAYINGDTQQAAVLAAADDAQLQLEVAEEKLAEIRESGGLE